MYSSLVDVVKAMFKILPHPIYLGGRTYCQNHGLRDSFSQNELAWMRREKKVLKIKIVHVPLTFETYRSIIVFCSESDARTT